MLLPCQRGDNKPRIGFACGPFRLGHDPAFAAPTLARLPGEVLEAARRLFGPSAQLGGLGEFGLDLSDEPAVLGQAEQEIDAIVLAPGHQRLAGETRIGTQQDAYPRFREGRLFGQRWRMRATIRAISSTLPALASMLAGRNLAANRCRPQNT